MINLCESVNITPSVQASILANTKILMGFEVEFVYVNPKTDHQQAAMDQAHQDLASLGLRFGATGYQLMPDRSIETVNISTHQGMELVSAPQPLHKAMDDLKLVFEWMQHAGHVTNASTGLHVNISVPDLAQGENLDKLKLVLLLDESHVQKLFDRLVNTYTQSHVQLLKAAVAQAQIRGLRWTKIREIHKLKTLLNDKIDLEKYRTVNFGKLKHGYLEFRIMGNQDYHKRWPVVQNMIIRYAYVLLAALVPDQFEQEYRQKLLKLISAGINHARPVYPDLAHKYASVGSAQTLEDQHKNLDYLRRIQLALREHNTRAAVLLFTQLLQRADKFSYGDVRSDLINAAALSYRVLIKKWLNMDVAEFAQAQATAGVRAPVIAQTHHYLSEF